MVLYAIKKPIRSLAFVVIGISLAAICNAATNSAMRWFSTFLADSMHHKEKEILKNNMSDNNFIFLPFDVHPLLRQAAKIVSGFHSAWHKFPNEFAQKFWPEFFRCHQR